MDDVSEPNESAQSGELIPADQVPARRQPENEYKQPNQELLEQLVDVEKKRIASADKRTEVMRFAIQANDDSDKRQFEYRMAQLQSTERQNTSKHMLGGKIFWFLSAGVLLLLTFLLVAAFFGSDKQSGIAIQLLTYGLSGVGGYGVLTTAQRGVRRFFSGAPGQSN